MAVPAFLDIIWHRGPWLLTDKTIIRDGKNNGQAKTSPTLASNKTEEFLSRVGNVRVMTGGQGDRRADEQKAANHCGGTVGSRSTRTPGTELQNNKSGAKSEQTQTESEQNKSDFLELAPST